MLYSEEGNLTLTFELWKGTERMAPPERERRWTLMMMKTTSVKFAQGATARGNCFSVMRAMRVRIPLFLAPVVGDDA